MWGWITDDMWQPRNDEKLRPTALGQRSPNALFVLLALLCGIIMELHFLGAFLTWLSWLLLQCL